MRVFTSLTVSMILAIMSAGVAQTSFDWQTLGNDTFMQQCSSCHKATGEGINGVYPSLINNERLLGDPTNVIQLVLNGGNGMPAFKTILSDEQIAAVISHERNSWGNNASIITPDMVTQTRDATSNNDSSDDASMADVTLMDGWEEQAVGLFTDNCAACHQSDGMGVTGAFPALAGNAYVTSEAAPVIATVLHGRGGMPSFSGLSDEAIAFILSYIRTSWGNNGSLISPEMVNDVSEGRVSPSNPNDPNYRPGAAN